MLRGASLLVMMLSKKLRMLMKSPIRELPTVKPRCKTQSKASRAAKSLLMTTWLMKPQALLERRGRAASEG